MYHKIWTIVIRDDSRSGSGLVPNYGYGYDHPQRGSETLAITALVVIYRKVMSYNWLPWSPAERLLLRSSLEQEQPQRWMRLQVQSRVSQFLQWGRLIILLEVNNNFIAIVRWMKKTKIKWVYLQCKEYPYSFIWIWFFKNSL